MEQFLTTAQAINRELHKVIVGQERLVHELLVTLLGGGNALMEGVPGLGKTMLVRTLAAGTRLLASAASSSPPT